MEYVKTPNLPDKKVKTIIIAEDTPDEIVSEFKRLGVKVVFAPKNPLIIDATATHPDLSIVHIGEMDFICAPFAAEEYRKQLHKAKIIECESNIKSPYPFDSVLNVAIIKNRVFLGKKNKYERAFENNEFEYIRVSQGYTKCNIAIINENAIVTEDASIYAAAVNCGMDVLKVDSGDIALSGYKNGFIGGACGKLDKDILALTGSLKLITEHEAIKSFCRNHGVYIIELSNKKPCDLGSILPIAY